MTATAAINGGYTPYGEQAVIPAFVSRNLAASAQVGRGQFVTVSTTTGYASLNDGTVPLQMPGGFGDVSELSDTSSVAGNARVRLSQRWATGIPSSTISNDGFTDIDWGTVFWIADENTPGKLSNYSGSNRSIGGLVFGLDTSGKYPVLFTGPVAGQLARAVHLASNHSSSIKLTADAATGTALSETLIPRSPTHGVVTAVTVNFDSAVTASDSNYAQLTVYKRDSLGATQTQIAQITTQTTGQALGCGTTTAFKPVSMTLSTASGALNLLETDVLTVVGTKSGSGVQLPASVVRVAQKVI